MDNPDEAADILHERVPDLDRTFLRTVVRDLNGENLWGVDGGLNPKIAEDTIDINVKLGNLAAAPKTADVLDQRFVEAAIKKLGAYKK